MSARLRRELGFLPLVAVVFFNVSGGPYGIEDTVGVFGPGLVLLLLLLTPLVWSLPVCLAMAELASALPEEGGYVAWVRRAFGPFWGFQAGWWSWVNSFRSAQSPPPTFRRPPSGFRSSMSPMTATPRKRLDRRLRKNPVRKFGLIAHPLARRRKQARGERLVPSVSEPRNIAQDPPDLFL